LIKQQKLTYILLARNNTIKLITSRQVSTASVNWSDAHHGASTNEHMWLAVVHDRLMWHISMSHGCDVT